MRQSQLFGKTLREDPKDEVSTNAKLLIRAGFVDKLMAGAYSYLPLGFRVLKKIEQVVREEMNAIGGQEVLMPMLHPKSIWMQTGGWENIDVLFKVKSRTEKEYALGQSEEEVVTPLVMSRVNTHQDLPIAVYQIHWKFRDELRAKSGVLRGVEFYMKDMYSFHVDQADFDQFYEMVKMAYLKVYQRLGLTAKVTEASGGSFSEKISYEFMVLTDAGEDDIFYCTSCEFCVNAEIAKVKEGDACPKCMAGRLEVGRASEVGNVFDLGQKYGKDFDLSFRDTTGEKRYPFMGCYGIGVSRLVGVVAEKYHDEKGIIWPESVAPYKYHIIPLQSKDEVKNREIRVLSEKLYESAKDNALIDDREGISAGEKFADADLIGLPIRIVISEKTLDKGGVEVKLRNESEPEIKKSEEVI